MTQFLSHLEAAEKIPDNSVITISSSSGLGCPDAMLKGLGEYFDATQQPQDLTILCPIAAGDVYGIKGIDHLAERKMIKKVIAGSYPSGPSNMPMPAIWQQITENQIPAYNVPSGIMFDLHRETAGKRPGVITQTGKDTFVDPDQQGCAMNALASEEPIVESLVLNKEEWLFFPSIIPDIAIIRATSADENGNLSYEHEGAYLGTMEQALAAHNNGGLVIAQVKRKVSNGTFSGKEIHVPGILVDIVVCDPDQLQTTQTFYDPAISGEINQPTSSFKPHNFSLEKVIARRAAYFLNKGDAANLGFGIAANIPGVLMEEQQSDKVTWAIEQGAVGGMPLGEFKFGCAANPEAMIPSPQQFTYFQGGGVNVAFLSFLQIDKAGNVNVSKLSKKPYLTAGVGGFIDITSEAPRIIYCGFFTAGAKQKIVQGKLVIEKQGVKKLVASVEQITFNGRSALKKKQEIFYVTERCVLRLTKEGLLLEEIAPGVDIQKDILDVSDAGIIVAENVRSMNANLFSAALMNLEIQ